MKIYRSEIQIGKWFLAYSEQLDMMFYVLQYNNDVVFLMDVSNERHSMSINVGQFGTFCSMKKMIFSQMNWQIVYAENQDFFNKKLSNFVV